MTLSTASGNHDLPMADPLVSTAPAPQASSTSITLYAHHHAPPTALVVPTSHNQRQSEPTVASVADEMAQMYGQQREKLKVLQKFLEHNGRRCPVCWILQCDSRDCANHNFAWHCPHFQQHKAGFKSFKAALNFPGYQVCYFCLIPQGDIFQHPLPAANAWANPKDCTYKDFLKPLLYLICILPGELSSILNHLDVPQHEWPLNDPHSLAKYLAEKSNHPEALMNLLEVFVVYIKIRQRCRDRV